MTRKKNKKKEMKKVQKELMKTVKKSFKKMLKNSSDEHELLFCTSKYGLSLALQNRHKDDFSLDTFTVAVDFDDTDVSIQGMYKTKEGGIKQIHYEIEWIHDENDEIQSVVIAPREAENRESENPTQNESQEFREECELRDYLLGRNPEDGTYRPVCEEDGFGDVLEHVKQATADMVHLIEGDGDSEETEVVVEDCTVEDSHTNSSCKRDGSDEIMLSDSAAHSISRLVGMTLHYADMKEMVNLREDCNKVEIFYRKMGEYVRASLVENTVPNFNLFFHPLFKPGLNITDGFEVREMRERIRELEPRLNMSGAIMPTFRTDFNIHRLFMILKKILGKQSERGNLVWDMDPKPYIMDAMMELRPDYSERAYTITQLGKSDINYCNDVAELYGILFVILIPNKEIFNKSGIIQAMRNPDIFHPSKNFNEDLVAFTNRIVDVYDGLQLAILHDVKMTLMKKTNRGKYTTNALETALLKNLIK